MDFFVIKYSFWFVVFSMYINRYQHKKDWMKFAIILNRKKKTKINCSFKMNNEAIMNCYGTKHSNIATLVLVIHKRKKERIF